MSLPYINVLGVNISTINMKMAVAQICDWVDSQEKHYVSVCTVHTIMECQLDAQMQQAVNNASMATPDGMPLVWLNKLKTNYDVSRVYGPDLLLALCQKSVAHNYRHFFYGGSEGVPEKLADNLQTLFPNLRIAGAYSPPFRKLTKDEDTQIIDMLNQSKADIIWVGLGTPKQDLWMLTHRHKLDASVLIAIGAAFDFHTGRVKQSPSWMQKIGLEWFFRLLVEPRRLWRRYVLYNPWFLWLLFLQLTGLRKFSTDPTKLDEL